MHPHHLLARHGEHAERVVGPQVGLGGERHPTDVVERLELVGVEASRVEGGSIVRDALVDAVRGGAQSLQLQLTQPAHRDGGDLVVGQG